MRKLICSLLILSVCCAASYGEFIYLKSGKVVSGKIIAEADDSITLSVSGTGVKRKIMLYDIDEVTKKPRTAPLPAPAGASAPSAEDAKIQFTSELRQEGAKEGETFVKDNKSGVLVFNVQETSVEKTKTVPAAQPAPANDDFDAALYLLGESAKNNPPADVKQPKGSKSKAKDDAAVSQKPAPAANDDNFDAALYLLSSEKEAEKPAEVKKEEAPSQKQQSNDDYYDPAMYLIDEQSLPAESAQSSVNSKKKEDKSVSEKPENETFLAVSFDLKGSNDFSGEVKRGGIKSDADKAESSDYGISLAAEHYGYISRFAAPGLGIGFQFKRCLEESPGRFGFLPLYGAFKMRFISEEDYHFYAVAHLGYNFLLANTDYLNTNDEVSGGLYYAGGLGASYHRYVLQILYSVNNASLNYSNSAAGDKTDKDVMYSKVGFYIGYLF